MAPHPLKIIFNCVLTFVLSLYANSQYPVKIVDDFMDFFINFIRDIFLENLKKDLLDTLKEANLSHTTVHNINKCFERYGTVFDPLSTDDKRNSILRKHGYFDADQVVIGQTACEKIVNNKSVIGFKPLYGVFVPLRKSFKLFLEIPNIFNDTLTYMNNLLKEKSVISNIVQAELWQKNYSNASKEIILPYFIVENKMF